jgi:hypothetical protein
MQDHLAGHEQKAPQLLQIAAAPYQKPHDHHTQFLVGLDVGSTTVKATVVDAAVISHPLDISDAWKNSYSCSTNHKVWAAKFTARHPNLVALEVSSFKCGHDAPIYGVIEGIIEQSGTPYFCFKDLDENKPSGSIRIRVETIDYFLRRYRDEVIRKRKAQEEIEGQLAALEAELRASMASQPIQREPEVQVMAAD